MEETRLLDRLAVNAAEAAKLLGVSRVTMYQYMNRKDFPAIRPTGPGGRVLIPVKGLEEWLLAQMKEAEP